jgi:4-diphosphocytidyl-2-C-methyl-D-erythritol kinase
MIQLKAYAKLNLSLDITDKRSDGYHELDGIMQSISLHDTVTIQKADAISIEMDNIHIDLQRNTAFMAAKAFARQTEISGARIQIKKRIPSESGLGGASADAAAVLIGLNELYGTGVTGQQLADIGVRIGADVPFALVGGTARAKGVGEKLRHIEMARPLNFVIVKPHAGVSTAEAFRRYKKSAPLHIDTVEYALAKGDLDLYLRYAGNALGMAALSIAPEIMKAANALMAAGAKRALMSGSGSTMFAPFATYREAQEAAARVKGDFAYCGAVSAVNIGIEIEHQETK